MVRYRNDELGMEIEQPPFITGMHVEAEIVALVAEKLGWAPSDLDVLSDDELSTRLSKDTLWLEVLRQAKNFKRVPEAS